MYVTRSCISPDYHYLIYQFGTEGHTQKARPVQGACPQPREPDIRYELLTMCPAHHVKIKVCQCYIIARQYTIRTLIQGILSIYALIFCNIGFNQHSMLMCYPNRAVVYSIILFQNSTDCIVQTRSRATLRLALVARCYCGIGIGYDYIKSS